MIELGAVSFGAPLALLGLALLPVLWWLLRITPPLPRRQDFPPLRLLYGLKPHAAQAAQTPWWLLLLRLLIVACAALGLARPLITPDGAALNHRPLVLVIDNTWAAAATWSARQRAFQDALDRAALAQRPVAVLTTAPPVEGTALAVQTFSSAEAARQSLDQLRPAPWGSDHRAALAALTAATQAPNSLLRAADVVWFSDQVASQGARPDPQATIELAGALQRLGSLVLRVPSASDSPPAALSPLVLGLPQKAPDGLLIPASRLGGLFPAASLLIEAVDQQGQVLGQAVATFTVGASEAVAVLPLPPDLQASVHQVRVAGTGEAPGAGGVVLFPETWRQSPVGLLTTPGQDAGAVPLLESTTYISRALTPAIPLYTGSLAELLERPLRTLIAVDQLFTPEQHAALQAWVDNGGVLVRFAGPTLAGMTPGESAQDDLLAVPIRSGNRSLGGSLSWSKPLSLAAYPPQSPLMGLPLPKDISVRTQILADPAAALAVGADLDRRTWARLSDGTPLITGAAHGKGWVVLVHTTADPHWSNLPLSGLFPALLQRLSSLGSAQDAPPLSSGDAVLLPPASTLSGLGTLGFPPASARPLRLEPQAAPPLVQAPTTPPGLYGQGGLQIAVNLADSAEALLTPLPSMPSGVKASGLLSSAPAALDLRPPLLSLALVLLVIDGALSLLIRGALPWRRGGALVLLAAVVVGSPAPTRAAEVPAALDTRLGYVSSGNPAQDSLSAAALSALTAVVTTRTSVALASPQAVVLAQDPLLFFPVLYWPIKDHSAADGITPEIAQKIALYRDQGGLVILDGLGPESESAVGAVATALHISALPLFPQDHVLSRSYYLSAGLPGRTAGRVWVESPDSRFDGVSTVIAGTNAWGEAWATGANGRPMLPMLSGGERGRELAYRSGVNMVLYALTGTYKADQIHLPALLERLPQ